MSSKYKDVLDGFICNIYPCIIYFWKPQDKSSLMVVTPGIMIAIRTVRMIRKIRNVLQVLKPKFDTPVIDLLDDSGISLSSHGCET